LPSRFLSPDRLLASLPFILRGYHDWHALGRLMGCSALSSCLLGLVGLVVFARRDV
jgi:hypothetical protein